MKAALFITAMLFGASASAALNSETMTCAEVRAEVQAKGKAKFLAGETYSGIPNEVTLYATGADCRKAKGIAYGLGYGWVPTLDNRACAVRLCKTRTADGTIFNEQYKGHGDYLACQEGASKSTKVRNEEQDEFGNAIGTETWTRVDTCINGRWTVTQGNPADAYQACTNGATWSDEIHVKVWDNQFGDERDGRWLGTNIYTCVNGKFRKNFVPRH